MGGGSGALEAAWTWAAYQASKSSCSAAGTLPRGEGADKGVETATVRPVATGASEDAGPTGAETGAEAAASEAAGAGTEAAAAEAEAGGEEATEGAGERGGIGEGKQGGNLQGKQCRARKAARERKLELQATVKESHRWAGKRQSWRGLERPRPKARAARTSQHEGPWQGRSLRQHGGPWHRTPGHGSHQGARNRAGSAHTTMRHRPLGIGKYNQGASQGHALSHQARDKPRWVGRQLMASTPWRAWVCDKTTLRGDREDLRK
ncbi:hypothetical protein V6N13_072173 [Hibiscus sabdariffa]|uniref:Uncharacterized protein n=1 Tax=Hibiscus sabdariffa TaxID=183260 RepID=A0ABR2BUB9_9ROSI